MKLRSVGMIRRPRTVTKFGMLRVPQGQANDPSKSKLAYAEMKQKIQQANQRLGTRKMDITYGDEPTRNVHDPFATLTVKTEGDVINLRQLLKPLGFDLKKSSKPEVQLGQKIAKGALDEYEYTASDGSASGYRLLVDVQDTKASMRIQISSL